MVPTLEGPPNEELEQTKPAIFSVCAGLAAQRRCWADSKASMGILSDRFVFPDKAPDISVILERVEKIAGLEVAGDSAQPDELGDLYAFRSRVAFAAAPEEAVEVYAYQPGAVEAHTERVFGEVRPGLPRLQGADESPNTQSVYLRGHVGQELTLVDAVARALEELGGHSPQSRAELESRTLPVSLLELAGRRKRNRRHNRLAALVLIPLNVILLPVWLLGEVFILPWRLLRAHRVLRKGTGVD